MELWKGLEHGAAPWCGPHHLLLVLEIKIIIIIIIKYLNDGTLLYFTLPWSNMAWDAECRRK